MRILTICPSKRQKQLNEMLDSFYSTKSYSDIHISTEDDTITNIFNKALYDNPTYDYYHLANDDIIYHTPHWDTKLALTLEEYGGGIAYGNDLLQGKNLPTFPMISANIAESLGWLQMPKLEFLYGDSVWKEIGTQADCLYYVPEVIIEHRHVLKTNKTDDVYERTNSKDQYKKDRMAYVTWLSTRGYRDIAKVRSAVNG